jgi:hypothetical protein
MPRILAILLHLSAFCHLLSKNKPAKSTSAKDKKYKFKHQAGNNGIFIILCVIPYRKMARTFQ